MGPASASRPSQLLAPAGIVVGGIPITLLDTAGMRESVDLVEQVGGLPGLVESVSETGACCTWQLGGGAAQACCGSVCSLPRGLLLLLRTPMQIGVERSVAAARQADICLMVVDAEAGWTADDTTIFQQMFGGSSGSSGSEEGSARDSGSNGGSSSRRNAAPALLVLNKTDLAAAAAQQQNGSNGNGSSSGGGDAAAGVPQDVRACFAAVVQTSAATLAGMEELRQAVLDLAGAPQVRASCSTLAVRCSVSVQVEAVGCRSSLPVPLTCAVLPGPAAPAASPRRRELGCERAAG